MKLLIHDSFKKIDAATWYADHIYWDQDECRIHVEYFIRRCQTLFETTPHFAVTIIVNEAESQGPNFGNLNAAEEYCDKNLIERIGEPEFEGV